MTVNGRWSDFDSIYDIYKIKVNIHDNINIVKRLVASGVDYKVVESSYCCYTKLNNHMCRLTKGMMKCSKPTTIEVIDNSMTVKQTLEISKNEIIEGIFQTIRWMECDWLITFDYYHDEDIYDDQGNRL